MNESETAPYDSIAEEDEDLELFEASIELRVGEGEELESLKVLATILHQSLTSAMKMKDGNVTSRASWKRFS